MDKKTIKQHVQNLAKTGDELYAKLCEVISLDGNLCELKPIDGSARLHEVSLHSSDGASVKYTPVIGSLLCCVFISKTKAVVVGYSELERLSIGIKSSKIEVTAEGISLKKGDLNLGDLLTQCIDVLTSMQVPTSNGPQTILPNYIIELEQVKTKLNQLLN